VLEARPPSGAQDDGGRGNRPRPSRREIALLALALVAALALRVWGFGDLGVDHFDEGVYAFSAHGLADADQPHRLWPEQVKFSPLVYPGATAIAHSVLGTPADVSGVLVNAFLGTLTVIAVWWIGRLWFGPAAGLMSAILLGFSEFHIGLSRSGLTDVAFALFFLLALAAMVRALKQVGLRTALLAGLAIGLAWNTKYHGWLVVPISGVGWLLACALRRSFGDWRRAFAILGVASVVAAACYLPWALFVEAGPDGYVGLMEYQRTMFQAGWLDNLWQQLLNQLYLDGPLGRSSVLLAPLAAVTLTAERWVPNAVPVFRIVLLVVVATLLGGAGAVALLALLSVPGLLRSRDRADVLPAVTLAAWLGIWIILTPMYRPYARLVLPFTIAACLAAPMALLTLFRARETAGGLNTRVGLALGALAVAVGGVLLPDPSNPWRPSSGPREAVAAMTAEIPEGSRVIVLGAPSVAYYLHRSGRPSFERVPGADLPAALDSAGAPVYVVFSLYSRRTGAQSRNLEELGDRLSFVGSYGFEPKDLRFLDDYPPEEAYALRANRGRDYDLELYRYSPEPSGGASP
jgi:4-amino-4-deoxy-L-arabinose transferase-like glycosyltransferase